MIETIEVNQVTQTSSGKLMKKAEEEKQKEQDQKQQQQSENQKEGEATTKKEVEWKWGFRWRNIIYFIFVHIGAIYGLNRIFYVSWLTIIWTYLYAVFSGFGVTAGAHRLWAHRSYKAKLPLRILLAILFTATWQRTILEWCINHRVHHKYSDTDADPHNSNRGFFFSHVGWLCITPHPECEEKSKKMYIDDLLADPVVYWQHMLFHPLAEIFCFIVPTFVPVLLWDENLWDAFWVCGCLRAAVVLESTFTVNSLAHMYGYKAYDVSMKASKNRFVTWITSGEGFHNYHHAFPRDYAACEFSNHKANKTTKFIDFMASIGLAYDRIKVDPEIIRKRRMRTGDWSLQHGHSHDKCCNDDSELDIAQLDY